VHLRGEYSPTQTHAHWARSPSLTAPMRVCCISVYYRPLRASLVLTDWASSELLPPGCFLAFYSSYCFPPLRYRLPFAICVSFFPALSGQNRRHMICGSILNIGYSPSPFVPHPVPFRRLNFWYGVPSETRLDPPCASPHYR